MKSNSAKNIVNHKKVSATNVPVRSYRGFFSDLVSSTLAFFQILTVIAF